MSLVTNCLYAFKICLKITGSEIFAKFKKLIVHPQELPDCSLIQLLINKIINIPVHGFLQFLNQKVFSLFLQFMHFKHLEESKKQIKGKCDFLYGICFKCQTVTSD